MRLLIDTHLLLWGISHSRRLSAKATSLLSDPGNEYIFSSVNIWEVTIKHALGRPDFEVEPRLLRHTLLGRGFEELVMTSEHAMAVGRLPAVHRDPFDRLLIAQASVEGIFLVTADAEVATYPGPIIQV